MSLQNLRHKSKEKQRCGHLGCDTYTEYVLSGHPICPSCFAKAEASHKHYKERAVFGGSESTPRTFVLAKGN